MIFYRGRCQTCQKRNWTVESDKGKIWRTGFRNYKAVSELTGCILDVYQAGAVILAGCQRWYPAEEKNQEMKENHVKKKR